VGLYSGGGAYIWNEVSVSTCGGLIHGGGLIYGGLIVGGLRYIFLCLHAGQHMRICIEWVRQLQNMSLMVLDDCLFASPIQTSFIFV
jgi:hypothetical protein